MTDEFLRPLLVTLVHGTWGRGFWPSKDARNSIGAVRWFEENGSFRQQLDRCLRKEGFEPKFVNHLWSGSNSGVARDDAAQDLKRVIELHQQEEDAQGHLIVGHSHGGNVALRGCLRADLSGPTAVVTLATPFIEAIPAPDHGLAKVAVKALPVLGTVMLGPVIALAFIALFAEVERWSSHMREFERTAPRPVLVAFMIIVILFSFFIAKLISASSMRLFQTKKDFVEPLFARERRRHDRRNLLGLLVLRGVDDEASLVLAAGSIATRLANRLAHIGLVFALLLVSTFGLLVATLRYFGTSEDRSINVSLSIAAIIGGLTFLMILGSSLSKMVYGREYFFRILTTDVNAHSVPDTVCNSNVHTLSYHVGMRHALYDHKDAAPVIASWTADRFAEKSRLINNNQAEIL